MRLEEVQPMCSLTPLWVGASFWAGASSDSELVQDLFYYSIGSRVTIVSSDSVTIYVSAFLALLALSHANATHSNGSTNNNGGLHCLFSLSS